MFIFATIVGKLCDFDEERRKVEREFTLNLMLSGQVGNVITNRNANRLEFERLLDGAKTYMRHHKVTTCAVIKLLTIIRAT